MEGGFVMFLMNLLVQLQYLSHAFRDLIIPYHTITRVIG